eukprot:366129-Amphidinium_carterae.1
MALKRITRRRASTLSVEAWSLLRFGVCRPGPAIGPQPQDKDFPQGAAEGHRVCFAALREAIADEKEGHGDDQAGAGAHASSDTQHE